MKIVKFIVTVFVAACPLAVLAAEEPRAYRATLLPEPLCTLEVPLRLGYQLGIPARDNSAFYAECFSKDALRQEIARLNERVEIGLLVSHSVDPDNGRITVTLSNDSEELRGITLRTGHLLQGRTYVARVTGAKVRGERGVILRLVPVDGGLAPVDAEERISRWRSESKLEWSLVPQRSGFYNCIFMIHPRSEIKLRGFSLLPEESVSIWRKESIDVLRSAGAGVFRWPVVEGMDFYNWYDGIGERSARTPVQSGRTGLTHHDFGTAEYVDFCRVVGVEPLICVPLYTPGCGDTRVKDLNAAAQMAADWVAYCNADDDHPLALLREKNGLGEPLRVNHWEVTAPPAGALLSADMIASACLHTVNAMKAEDPDILVGVTLQDGGLPRWATVRRGAGARIDFVSSNADGAAETVGNYNRANGRSVMLADTMLRGDYGEYAEGVLSQLEAGPGNAREYYINWYRSLGLANAAVRRLGLCRDGPVCLPYYAEQVLGLDYGTTRLSTDIGLLSAMIGRFPVTRPLKCELEGGGGAGAPVIYPAWGEDGSLLVLFAYNPAPVEQRIVIDVGGLKRAFVFCIMDQLSGEMGSERRGESVQVMRSQKAGAVNDRKVECLLGPASFSRILVKE